MKRTTLSLADAAWLEETFARNRARFGGFSMELDDEHDDDPDEGGDQEDDSDADDGDEAIDWKAKFEAQQRINRNLERRTRKDAARLKQLDGGKPVGEKKDDTQKDDVPDRDAIRAEVEREALRGRIEDKIEVKARAFADPEDAVAVLLRTHNHDDFLDDNDKIDVEAIADALKELGEKKPHLLAQGGRFQGDADGGARKDTPSRAKSLGEAISRHYDKS